ncbi:MAG: hypothetical protein B6242_12535 [Anaerolineaceae bacterium 4572_78]|nr:MAG: hypothetical protein B6242_12535 [Anaerolineaceae bacterium 4572_78]
MKQKLIELNQAKAIPIWLMLAAFVALIYIGVAQLIFGYSGFPLDDSWIYQTYARNLGEHGQLAFRLGQPSTGSTAPLWTILLSIGYAMHIPFKLWTYSLGILFLGLSGFNMALLSKQLFPDKLWLGSLIGLAVVIEWHLVWAAVSGMETIFFIWLSIFILERYATFRQSNDWGNCLSLGILGGFLILTRPEGIGLIGLIGLEIIITSFQDNWSVKPWFDRQSRLCPSKKCVGKIILIIIGLAIPTVPYLIFNYFTTGMILPNTFYAKQAEYAMLLSQIRFFERWLDVCLVTLIGGQALLIPGLLKAFTKLAHKKSPLLWLIAVWWFSLLTLYAIRLPITYQHGRYQIPTIPWLLLLGIWGISYFFSMRSIRMRQRIFSQVGIISITLAMVLFIGIGANGYANDVQFIETEMVTTAHWLEEHTEPEEIIASHDIGAIGYFSQRSLVDLAGLVTPDVIPFIRNEKELLAFSKEQGADYLVVFPSWYPTLTETSPQIYTTQATWAKKAGYENMAVYRIE